ncbi:MAG: DUF3467 domain-containing protein [bacterium]|nr:DUF3467 domain-containing protein [bacterium]
MADVKIVPFRKEDKSRQYANYVRVNSSHFEVTLQFSDVKPASDDIEQAKIKKEGILKTPIDIEIVLPLPVAEEFAKLLQQQLTLLKVNKRGKDGN